MISVIIAEDDAFVRNALVDLVTGEDDFDVVGIACDAAEAIDLARELRPDLALVDVRMPHGGGHRAAREMRRISPATRVVAHTVHDDRGTVLEMLRAGAVGYLVKGATPETILTTLRRVSEGRSVLAPEVTAAVLDELLARLDEPVVEPEVDGSDPWRTLGESVTKQMRRRGLDQKTLARIAGTSPQVVRDVQNGQRRAYRPSTLARIATALGWTPEMLLRALASGEAPPVVLAS